MTALTVHLAWLCAACPMLALGIPAALVCAADRLRRRRHAPGPEPRMYAPGPAGRIDPGHLRQHPELDRLERRLDHIDRHHTAQK